MYLRVWCFFNSYLPVEQLIFRKSVAVSLDENKAQGRVSFQECLTLSLPDTSLSHIWYEMRSPCFSPYLQSSVWATFIVQINSSPRFIMNHWHLLSIGTMLLNNGGWKFRWAINCHADIIDTGITNKPGWTVSFQNRQHRSLNHGWQISWRNVDQIWCVEDEKKIHYLPLLVVFQCASCIYLLIHLHISLLRGILIFSSRTNPKRSVP